MAAVAPSSAPSSSGAAPSGTGGRQIPIVCPGHTRPLAELQFLTCDEPDAEKRTRADWVIETDTLEHARAQVFEIVKEIRERLRHA